MRFSSLALAGALCVAIATSPASAELQWRPGRGSQSTASAPFKKQVAQTSPATQQTSRAPQAPKSDGILRIRIDSNIQPTAFEDGPQLTAADEGNARFRSVVVGGDAASGAVRSAQLPPAEPGGSADDLFGPLPQDNPPPPPQPMDDTDISLPQDGTLPIGPSTEQDTGNNLRQPGAGTEFQPQGAAPRPIPFAPPPENVNQSEPALPQASDSRLDQERDLAADACEKGVEDIRSKTIGKLSLEIAVQGEEGTDYPFECVLDQNAIYQDRCWAGTTYMWKASALCHKPLYFEDEQLERYGHSFSPCFQPFVSGAHFFCTIPVLPYCMGVTPPNECIYALGHYRPGSCAPYYIEPIPLSPRGALFQAGATVGAAAILP